MVLMIRRHSVVQVEEAECEFLLIHGADDLSVRPVAATYIPDRLEGHGKNNYRVLLYPGAGHIIEPPHSPHYYGTYMAMYSKCRKNMANI